MEFGIAILPRQLGGIFDGSWDESVYLTLVTSCSGPAVCRIGRLFNVCGGLTLVSGDLRFHIWGFLLQRGIIVPE